MLDLERWVRFRWKLHPDIAVGDSKYGSIANIVGLEQDGIRAYLAKTDYSLRTKVYSVDKFHYDPQTDCYLCPQGQRLYFSRLDTQLQTRTYRASTHICRQCPVKAQCTTAKSDGRRIQRSFYQTYLDRLITYQTTPAYQKAMRKRAVWIEPMFGEAKQWHQSVKFRLRRLRKVNIQALLTAAGQNIKRLLKPRYFPRPLQPIAALALQLPPETPSLVIFNLKIQFYLSLFLNCSIITIPTY